MEKILLAVDGSDHSERAASMAGELGHCTGVLVDIMHVVPERMLVPSAGVRGYMDIENVYLTQRDLLESLGRDAVTHAASLVRQAGGKVGSEEVAIGHPAHEIVAHAERLGSDCIVMGRRGLGDMGGLLMGSVSHKVGHLTDTTLITTR